MATVLDVRCPTLSVLLFCLRLVLLDRARRRVPFAAGADLLLLLEGRKFSMCDHLKLTQG